MKNIYRSWIRPLLSNGGILVPLLLNYNPSSAGVLDVLESQAEFYFFRGKSEEAVKQEEKKAAPKEEEKKVTPSKEVKVPKVQKEVHKARIYATDPSYPNVLLNEVGPATYSTVKVGNDGIDLNLMYKDPDKGNHLRFTATSRSQWLENLKSYIDKQESGLYTEKGKSTKKNNLEGIITNEGTNLSGFSNAIDKGVLTPEEVAEIREGQYPVWIESIDNETGEIKASFSIILDINYQMEEKETKDEVIVKPRPYVLVHAPETKTKEARRSEFGVAARFYEGGAVAPEFSGTFPVCNDLNVGAYGSIGGPETTESNVDSIIGGVSPEGTQGIGAIERVNREKLKGAYGLLASYLIKDKVYVSLGAGNGFVEGDSTRVDTAQMYREGRLIDSDNDTINYGSKTKFVTDVTAAVGVKLSDRVSIGAGGGRTGGKKFAKGVFNYEF